MNLNPIRLILTETLSIAVWQGNPLFETRSKYRYLKFIPYKPDIIEVCKIVPAVYYELANYYHEASKGSIEQEPLLKAQLTEINKKIENIEEKYYALGEMNKDTFEKFHKRFLEERGKVSKLLQECATSISTLNESVHQAVQFSSKLFQIWDSSEVGNKELLQKLIFPEGILFDREKEAFRPVKTNFIFELIQRQTRLMAENEKGTKHLSDDLSLAAEREGFEPPDL